jgi:excinuclease ABC subunit C
MSQISLEKKELTPASIREKLPEGPGVYLFKDASDSILYIGKAKDLRKRVLSYFKPTGDLPYKTALMLKRARGLDIFLTATENEAFILEDTLVKKHMPRYNIVLRDDKRYPCLRLDIKEPYPKLTIVRRIKKDGALYFGPFSSANAVRSTLKLINRVFQLRKCKTRGLPGRSRPCLNYQLERCLGPCARDIDQQGYGEIVKQVRMLLEGRNQELLKQLKKNLETASKQLLFEKAARIRDQIRAVEKVTEHQAIVSPKLEDQDVLGIAQKDGLFEVVVLFVRRGYLSGSRDYLLRNRGGSASEVMEAFLKQYYLRESFIPKRIFISEDIEDLASIGSWLTALSGRKVTIHHPLRGEKRRLTGMAVKNAENLLAASDGRDERDLVSLAKTILQLQNAPEHIEGLDISNIQGDMAVGAIVSFANGLPWKAGYKNYKIRNNEGIDDYGMMAELASRRLARGEVPDLFVVDGGKGHLSAVQRVCDNFSSIGREAPEVVSIAKGGGAKGEGEGGGDRVYIPGRKNPVTMGRDHPVLHFLMRIRDEAHRRAVTYHRKRREKRLHDSLLDQIPGVGPKRKRDLIRHFGNIDAMLRAEPEELSLVPGISTALAKNIRMKLDEEKKDMG